MVGIKRILTIFFIPLIPLPETFRATCDGCESTTQFVKMRFPSKASRPPPADFRFI